MSALITGFLSGTLAATIVSLFAHWWFARRASELEHLRKALSEFYGPVMWLLINNKRLFDHYWKIHEAYEAEYCGKRYAESAVTSVERKSDAVLKAGNAYAKKARDNLDKILQMADEAAYLIDLNDLETIADIRHQVDRLQIESESSEFKEARLVLNTRVGDIHSFKSEWLKIVKESYARKYDRYSRLSGIPSAVRVEQPN